ncbi:hypothetical protein J7H99_004713 [Vibrio parahaemolyticus]|uniref:hypothetical protein n=1 Tax=Vibrio parahaemolyticus TaxID=670 RepID=UPI001655FAB1|nr:hypothetical protein [Vibrio parahaemolyticus]EGQ9162876.1 hypothetical protein [Vibrio parahaemolyticus]EGR1384335.1 hypothetical protein [Vibrio parahaemolyticus]EHH1218981.1 hypothetical protein [Vibrio parahaemolyticus]EJS4022091.1 hypothetical protein [Vibrio parahaemolyticus]ELA7501188.1 hypothetical protein [Vibrio parahaemolyticus]
MIKVILLVVWGLVSMFLIILGAYKKNSHSKLMDEYNRKMKEHDDYRKDKPAIEASRAEPPEDKFPAKALIGLGTLSLIGSLIVLICHLT